MGYRYKLEMHIEVSDIDKLSRAALTHPDCLDVSDITHADHDSIDVSACLLMILDPGHLVGCKIVHSECEKI